MKYTGEVWNIGEDGDIFADDCVCVALIVHDCFEAPQNAALMAAAPELLSALERVRHAFYVDGSTKALRAAFAGTKELVMKAKGTL